MYAPYPNLLAATINDRTLTAPVGKPVDANVPFTLVITGIKNPAKEGGTG